MRVVIYCDMEGVAGITNWEQVTGGTPLYDEARELYTEEVNAAARGAFAAGASEVVVLDCHGAGEGWMFNSLIPDKLDERVEFVVQRFWTEYTEPLEQGCDAALLVGMHAMAGTADGGLNHTVSGTGWRSLRFNGTAVGESGINAALCGTWGCPVVLVTGDEAVCREGRELLGPALTTVAVKRSLGRFSARHRTPAVARRLIEQGATESIRQRGSVSPYEPGRPCTIEVEFGTSDTIEQFHHNPVVEVVDGRTVRSQGDDWWTAWRQFYFSYQWPD